MAGALNKLPVAISGMIFFDAPVTFFSVTAVIIGLVGGLQFFLTRRIRCGCGVCYCEESPGQARQNGLAHD